MFRYYLTTASRNLRRHFKYTLISIIGLSLGMASFIVLINYAHHERNFDTFNKDAANIYRCESYFSKNGVVSDSWVTSSFGYAQAIKESMPEIQDIVRINNNDCERIVRYGNHIYREPRVVFADSNFFSFFSYPLLKGDVKTVLRQPNTIAISAAMATKYFGHEDPMGKMLEIKNISHEYLCMVTGVFEDMPANSHLKLDLMMSYMTTDPWERDLWYMHEAYTYAKVSSAAAAKSVEQKFPALAEKYKTDPVTMKDHVWGINLVPLQQIHLNPAKPYEREVKGSASMIDFLFMVGMVILVVGWINYINIAISKALQRAGEVSIRKVAGAGKSQLLKQFMTESLLVNAYALLAVALLLMAFSPLTSSLFGINLDVYINQWQTTLICLISGFTGGTVITGIIPVLILNNMNAAAVLKNKSSFKNSFGLAMREGLIGFQYLAAIVLIVATITIQKQMHFMQAANTGVNMQQTLIIQTPSKEENYEQRIKTFVEILNGYNDVKAATVSSSIPGKPVGFVMANKRADDPEKISRLTDMLRVDEQYIPSFGLEMVAGRNFDKDNIADQNESIILNESAVHFFGFKDNAAAISGYLNLEGQNDKRFPIIGIVKNHHHLSLKEAYTPFAMVRFSPWNALQQRFISVKLNSKNMAAAVGKIESAFKNAFPASSFDAFFLDDYFNRQYEADIKYGKMVMAFAWLALAIVCLGIFGLSSFILLKRTKEIGVRKIIGASTLNLLLMLNKRFIKTMSIAFVIAVPAAWILMSKWLQGFATRTQVEWWVFALAALITILVSAVTVTVQSYKSLTGSMINALRSE